MGHVVGKKRNVGTIKALRGESLTIDLGKTLEGNLRAWMKKDPNSEHYRSFEIIENRYLKLPKSKTLDYLDIGGNMVEEIAGRWFFDVESVPTGGSVEDSVIAYTGNILFVNQITGSNGYEIV